MISEFLKRINSYFLTDREKPGNILPVNPSEGIKKMHFRERNQIVQIIRTKYDAATKKGKNEIVGRLMRSKPTISDELKTALTPDERKEVAAWIAGHASVERLKAELAVRTLQEHMTMAETWFENTKGDEARFLAASLIPAWARLRAVLKKSGHVE